MRGALGIAIIGIINAFKLNLFMVHISLKGLFQKIVQIFVSLKIVSNRYSPSDYTVKLCSSLHKTNALSSGNPPVLIS